MKKYIWMAGICLLCGLPGQAQDPTGLIAKVIKAIDLQIQRFQTNTIWLQEAQKEVENAMSKLHLDEITDWVTQFRDLYQEYFQELWRVKQVLASYDQVARIIQRQKDIVTGVQRAMSMFNGDSHFTAAELARMGNVYTGILTQSVENLDQLTKVLTSLLTQMTDQERLAIIDGAARDMDRNYRDMQVYTTQNQVLSMERASDQNDYEALKKIYGL